MLSKHTSAGQNYTLLKENRIFTNVLTSKKGGGGGGRRKGGARWEGGDVVEGNRRRLDSWFASRVHEKGLGKEKRETQLVRIKYLVVCEQFWMRGDCLIFATNHSMTEDLHGDGVVVVVRGGGLLQLGWDEPFLVSKQPYTKWITWSGINYPDSTVKKTTNWKCFSRDSYWLKFDSKITEN